MATGIDRLFQQARLLSEQRGREMEAAMNRYKGIGKAGFGVGYGLARLFGAGADEMQQAEREDAYAAQFLQADTARQQELMTGATALSPALGENLRPYMERNQANEILAQLDAAPEAEKTLSIAEAGNKLLAIPSQRDLGIKLLNLAVNQEKASKSGSGTEYINNVRFITESMGGDPDNPNDLMLGARQFSNLKGHGTFKDTNKFYLENLDKGREDSEAEISAINTANDALRLLEDDNEVIMGFMPETRMGFAKMMNYLGLTDGESIAKTKQYLATTAKLVAKEIKNFGAGTGLSDADRKFAQDMTGANAELTPEAARRILMLGVRANQRRLKRRQENILGSEDRPSQFSEEFWRENKINKDAYIYDIPEMYQRPVEKMGNYELQTIFGLPETVTKDMVKRNKQDGGYYYKNDQGVWTNLETGQPFKAQTSAPEEDPNAQAMMTTTPDSIF